MNTTLTEKMNFVTEAVRKAKVYEHTITVLEFDMETVCPPEGMEAQGELISRFVEDYTRIIKQEEVMKAVEELHQHRDELAEPDRVLIDSMQRDYTRTKNITPEMESDFSRTFNKAFISWSKARKESDFSLFAPDLKEAMGVNLKQIELNPVRKPVPYDNLLAVYERGMTTEILDATFDRIKERLIPLLKRIQASPKAKGGSRAIRTDFLTRKVPVEQQQKITRWLLETLGFDFNRGNYATSEHPFTSGLAQNDTRITTHYYEDMFFSNIFSVIHECGHALFEQNTPDDDFKHFINDEKTLGQHESVSRFYENILCRSRAFISFLYPKLKELFPDAMEGVSEDELYEAVNTVSPSLIRTEADEFTYTFHIIIRYEIEKALFNDGISIDGLNDLWKQKYQDYLGVTPATDREGILQDVHWTSGFGYFTTYAIGNMYNAMYFNRMKKELDVDALLKAGSFTEINAWMKENVWSIANHYDPAEWIEKITGRKFTPDDFLDYLEDKYSRIYEL